MFPFQWPDFLEWSKKRSTFAIHFLIKTFVDLHGIGVTIYVPDDGHIGQDKKYKATWSEKGSLGGAPPLRVVLVGKHYLVLVPKTELKSSSRGLGQSANQSAGAKGAT